MWHHYLIIKHVGNSNAVGGGIIDGGATGDGWRT
jgi:hypothetical protein